MSRWMNFVADGGVSWRTGCCFDPGTLMLGSMAATAAGGVISASNTLAGGSYAAQAGETQKAVDYRNAEQLTDNAAQAFATGQRKALDTTQTTKLAESTALARGSASGVNAGVGSPASDVGKVAQRGSYHALMDMFNGESESTGLLNEAAGQRFQGDLAEVEGEQKKKASRLAAAGTLASTAGSMFATYGGFKYPNLYGRAGATA